MRSLTWIGIVALSSSNLFGLVAGGLFVGGLAVGGCASGNDTTSNDTSGTSNTGGNAAGGNTGGNTGGNSTGGNAAGGNAGGNGAGGMGVGGAAGGAGGVTYTGTLLDGFTQNPLDGAAVCGLDPVLTCVATNANGGYIYPGIPENTRVRVGASIADYFPVEALIDSTDMDGTLSAFMLSNGIITLGLQSVGTTFDNTKPAVSIIVRDVNDAGLADYTVDLSATTGEGPFFLDGMSIVSNRTTTTDSGTAFYVNVDPGDYEVTVSGALTCTPSFITGSANTHTAPLINAAQFIVLFTCQ